MTASARVALAALALTLAACQGSFGNGGGATGVNPPVNPNAQANPAATQPVQPSPSPTATAPPGSQVTYPFADAAKGYKCPEDRGYSCSLRFNVIGDLESPSPSPAASTSAKSKATATPSPTPTPTPTPTPSPEPSGSIAPSASPSAKPKDTQIVIKIAALPKTAPAMTSPNPAATSTLAIFDIRLHTDTDAILLGNAYADFTLPKEQIAGHMFAVQLYREYSSKNKVHDEYVGSYIESKVEDSTVSFSLNVPKFQIKKDEVWLIVLYAETVPSSSPSGSPLVSPSPSVAPSVKPSTTP